MKIAISADHGGYPLKDPLIAHLRKSGHEVVDLGTGDCAPCDYPDFAFAVADQVAAKQVERGIVICGSGAGACIAANKVKGVRACLCHDTYSAHQAVEHDDMNVLCLGARIIGGALAEELVTAFVNARFTGEERHLRRLNKVLARDK